MRRLFKCLIIVIGIVCETRKGGLIGRVRRHFGRRCRSGGGGSRGCTGGLLLRSRSRGRLVIVVVTVFVLVAVAVSAVRMFLTRWAVFSTLVVITVTVVVLLGSGRRRWGCTRSVCLLFASSLLSSK